MKERNDGGIKCSEIIDVLDDFSDGTLDAETTEKIKEHLSHCENCANFGSRYIAMINLLTEQRNSAGL